MLKEKNILIYLLFFLLSFIHICVNAQTENFEEALIEAKAQQKKIIVDVYTDWCGWCKKMDKEVYGNAEIKKIIKDNFILVKLDAEGENKINYFGKTYKASELAVFFEATGYPTTVFLDKNGNVIEYKYENYKMKNLPGYFKAPEFLKVLEFIRDDKYKDTDLSTIL